MRTSPTWKKRTERFHAAERLEMVFPFLPERGGGRVQDPFERGVGDGGVARKKKWGE